MKDENKIVVRSVKVDDSPMISKINNLQLHRFIKPTNIKLRKRDVISAYEVVLPKKDGSSFSNMDIKKAIEELRIIRQDIILLSKNGIKIDKIGTDNVRVTDDKVNIFDYSDISINHESVFTTLSNNIKINELFGLYLLEAENPDISRLNVIDKFYGEFLQTSNEYIEDFLEDKIKTDTIRKYLKKR